MQPFRVIFHIFFHELLVFSQCTQESSGDIECVDQDNASDKWILHGLTRESVA